jgi:hypothetical protein
MKTLKLVKTVLRFWIALTATGSFLAGWALFAHSPKPIQPNSGATSLTAALPTLAPLQPLDLSGNSSSAGIQSPMFNVQQQSSLFAQAPLLRTGGS